MNLKKLYIFFLITLILMPSTILANTEVPTNPKNNLTVQDSDNIKEPTINSRAAIVLERSTHTILYGKNENNKRKMASTTKIMTATIVLEKSNLNDVVTVSKKAAGTGGSRLGLKTNDKITVNDLLYGLMLCSGNDAAVALAEYVGGNIEGFAELMNSKATSLGLTNTNFVTPHGLDDDNHYTTAYELALLTDYALQNKTFKSIVSTTNYTVTINNVPKSLHNTNELLGNLNGVYGVKTGFTNGANRCLVTSTKRDNLDIICIVLGADTKKFRTQDSTKLIEYTFNNYKMVNVKNLIDEQFDKWKSENISKFSVNKAKNNNIQLSILKTPYELIPVKKSDISNITIDINCNFDLQAPIIKNSTIGNINVIINNESVLKLDILNNITIERKDIKFYLYAFIKKYYKFINFSEDLTI